MDLPKILEPWLLPIAIFIGFFLLFTICRIIVMWLLRLTLTKLPINTNHDIAAAIEKPLKFMIFIFGLFCALKASPIAHIAEYPLIVKAVNTCFIVSLYWILFNLSSSTNDLFLHILNKLGFTFDPSLSNILSTFGHTVLLALGFATVISEWGYDINGFIAGLSLGGLALSLAAKDALSNIFAGIVILADKPFTTGDWIVCNDIEGTVEKISFRSTSVRTFPQALVYIPNSLLTNTAITNYTKRNKRRIEINLGVTYSTTKDQMRNIIERIEQTLTENPHIYNEDTVVSFSEMASSSLNIRIVCYTNYTDYMQYAKIKEEINFALLGILSEVGASAAFPSTSVYMETPVTYEPKEK